MPVVVNVLGPDLTRYLNVENELVDYLEEQYRHLYGSDHDFRVTVGFEGNHVVDPCN